MNEKISANREGREKPERRQLKLQGHGLFVIGAILAALWAAQAFAGENPIKIALIADKTGPLEAYAKQTSAGFAMGLDYATGGSLMVEGHKLAVIEKDSQTKPDIGRNLLNEAYNDDGADIAVGGTNSAVALAMLPVARTTRRFSLSSPRLPIPSLVPIGTATFSAPAAIEPRTRFRTRSPSANRAQWWRRWRRITPSAATLSQRSIPTGADRS